MTTEQITGIGEVLAGFTMDQYGELLTLEVQRAETSAWASHPQLTQNPGPDDVFVVTLARSSDDMEHTGVTVLRPDGSCSDNFDAQ